MRHDDLTGRIFLSPPPVLYVANAIALRGREMCRRLGERRRNGPPVSGGIMRRATVAQAASLPILTAESGLTRYLEEIRRFDVGAAGGVHAGQALARAWRP